MKHFVWLGLFVCITLVPMLTTARIISLQENRVSVIASESDPDTYQERGPIFDRKGNILAMQVNSWNVGLRLIDTKYPNEVIALLSEILTIPASTIKNKLSDPSKYVRIKKLISRKEYDAIMNSKKDGKLSGVQVNEISWRKYPGNDSIAPVIGYYGENGSGLDGIEASMNQYLTPQKNNIGNSVYLTIDSVLQSSIEQIVKETLAESQSTYISTILMDAHTGEILSMVSEPSFDLNRYYMYNQAILNNKIIQYNYEPGSVFKVFSIASLLDNGTITPYSTFDATKPYTDTKYGFTIQDIWYPPEIINTFQIIKYSSNVGTSHAISYMDDDTYYQYLRKFGFGNKTGIDLPGESYGIFYSPDRWSVRSKPTIAFGQEIAVTAIQIVTAITALTNDGLLLKPQIIKKIVSSSGDILFESTPSVQRRVINAETARTVLEMMRTATEPGGTAHRLKIDGVNISAKTGTAEVFDKEKNIYSKDDFIASTLGVVPTENPNIIIYAAIHNPKSGEIYGGRTTAPMIRKMLKFILPYLGLAGEVYTANTHVSSQVRTNTPKNVIIETYGDYRGLRKREIWPLFINTDIQIIIKGNGTVIRQSPPAGAAINENKNLTLYLK